MPIYRYKCERGHITEFFDTIKHEPPNVCFHIVERTVEGEALEERCVGKMKRLYDTFHFHISGR